jgi:hypothetical protein
MHAWGSKVTGNKCCREHWYTHTHLLLELDDGGGVDLVHEPAENDPVLQYLGVVSLRHRLVQHSRDPLTERMRTGLENLFSEFLQKFNSKNGVQI